MSDLYKVNVLSATAPKVQLRVEAVNHEQQVLQDDPIFYFGLIGSIYWELNPVHKDLGFGIWIDKYREKKQWEASIPILEAYVDAVQVYISKNYNGGILDSFEDYERIEDFITVEVLEESRSQYDCACGIVELTFHDEQFFHLITAVERVGVVFDQAYF